jgi:hypothetical protein
LIVLWFVLSWFCWDKEQVKVGVRSKWFWIVLSFFLFHCISAAFSDNQREAVTSIEVKLSFLAFPYFLFLFRFTSLTIKNICVAFVSGCFFALITCLIRSAYLYLSKGENYFFYNDFSYWIHTGYFSMYMLFALVLVQLAYPVWFKEDSYNGKVRFFFTGMFLLGIFLCASKIGFIALFITGIILLIAGFRRKLNAKTIGSGIIILSFVVFLLYKFVPAPFERMAAAFSTTTSENIDKTSGESTAVRILIWKECADLIKGNFIFGVGGGDANDELIKRYQEHGLQGALEHNLNAHNQFFQTFIALGVFGFLILAILTFGTFVFGIIKKNLVLALFSLIIILNFLVESMLQTQAGNLFFVYFLCLLLRYDLLKSDFSEKGGCV